MTRRELPLTVPLFTGALALGAGGVAAATDSAGLAGPWWLVVPLTITLVIAGLIQIEFHWRGEREALDLFEAALVPMLAVFAGPGAVILVALAKGASQRLLRVAPMKAAFNVAQWAASAAVASWVYEALRGNSWTDLAGLGVAIAAGMVVNHLTVVIVLALVRGGSLRDVLGGLRPVLLAGWLAAGAVNISLGLVFAASVLAQPEIAVLFVVPLAVCGWAQRAYSEVVADRARIEALQQSTHALAAGDLARALAAVVEIVRSAFSATAVGVVIDGRVRSFAGDEDARAAIEELAREASPARRLAGRGGYRCALVAPVRNGALVSVDRHGLDGFEEGELAVFEALATEISGAMERADLHAEIVRDRAHLLDIVDGSSDGIFTVDVDGVIEDWNPAMSEITGFPADEARGGRVVTVLRPRTTEGDAPVPLDGWLAVGSGQLPGQLVVLTRDNKARTLACSFSRTAGDRPSLVVVARDVTRQHEVDRLRDDFVATVSHELRTPLTSIVGFTAMLAEPPRPLTTAEHDEAVVLIRKAARRLERLISNLLEVSRIEDRTPGLPGPVDIDAACANALDEAREAHPNREVRVVRGSGAMRAVGNQLSVEQILNNLIGNALKYSERGPIEVRVDESPEQVVISVTDRGPGIAPTEHERIFERFHRLDRHHVQAGTGLGLYISRRLAATMNGTVTVRSEPGRGSTFSLTLPAQLHLVAVS